MDELAYYDEQMLTALQNFNGQMITAEVIQSVRCTALAVQLDFLHSHPEYISKHEIHVFVNNDNTLNVSAPIILREEKRRSELLNEEIARTTAELEARYQRSQARMRKAHAKLTQKHGHLVTPNIRRIWDSLDIGQQYAILKDIDYAERHKEGQQ